jgi:hypothetical protein
LLRFNVYQLSFLQNDATSMAEQVGWAVDKPGVEDVLLGAQADTAAYSGRLLNAREFSRRAVAPAEWGERKRRREAMKPMRPYGKHSWALQPRHASAQQRLSGFRRPALSNTELRWRWPLWQIQLGHRSRWRNWPTI